MAASSSVTIDGYTYDVFLSFRGEDTRHGFTGSLWKALHDKGIHTFIDVEEIRKGEEITPSLLKAIEQSRMAIIVLSPSYATSSFCLDELSHILYCIRGRGRLVWPIFYEVDPSDVRWLKGTFGEAMDLHKKRSGDNTDKLQKWQSALQQVANLSGTHYEWKKGDGYQYKFIEEIVNQVSREIKPFTLYVANYLVGIEPQKQDVKLLLNVGSDNEVHMVGIHGIGGIGKTTLSLEVYNSIAHQFEGSCFLENVRENSEKHGLTYLQKIILSEIVGDKGIELTSIRQGISIIQQRLRQKKVLLILDDVDKLEQLMAIVGEPKWFGPGSRVIITTRDIGLLTSHGVKSTYGMKELSMNDALGLLKWKAFKTDNVSSIYADVLNRAATYASGLPLALEVIGSHLFEKGIEEWEYALDQYERIPDKKIQMVLEASFNTLEVEEKSAFLDIACCFKGYKLAEVEKILHAHHGDRTKAHIRVLVEKCFIKISESGNVTIHDLIEDMGKEIVRRESPEEPGKRSRLWYPKDIIQVLEENTGTHKVEIIYVGSWIDVKWDGEAFKKMENLKTLIIRCGHFSRSPKYLPNSLRILEWERYPSSGLPLDFYPKKLSICKLPYSEFTSIKWGDLFKKASIMNLFKKKFENMRVLNLACCTVLTKIPDVSGLPNLEEFSFQDCVNLITIDDSIGLLDKLKILCASHCRELWSFPPLKLPSLEQLDLSFCVRLESFPPVVDGLLDKLKILRADCCRKLRSFPPLKLASLEQLHLISCDRLEIFPPVVDGLLDKLKILRATSCRKLCGFPPLKLASLEQLHLSYCVSLESFPLVVDGLLDKLKILRVDHCPKLRRFPPLKLSSLEQLHLSYCVSLESFPPVVDGLLDKLKILRVDHCPKLWRIPPLKLSSLVQLDLSYCESLECLPPVVDGLMCKIEILRADHCKNLRSFPPLKLSSVEQLNLSECRSLESFPPLVDGLLPKLKILCVDHCSELKSIPPLNSPSLVQLNLSNCDSLERFPDILGEVENITQLRVDKTPIKELPFSFKNFTRLQTLNLSDCGIVQLPSSIMVMFELTMLTIKGGGWLFPKQDEGEEKEIPMQSSRVQILRLENCILSNESLAIGLKWFANVKELYLSGSEFTILPKCIEKCHFLWKLVLDDCPQLKEIKGIPPSLKAFSAFNCRSLTSSSRSKLLNQELLEESGNISFLLPQAENEIPKWFDHQFMKGKSISFWFRNKIPAIALCVVFSSTRDYSIPVRVIVNGNTFYGNKFFYWDYQNKHGRSESMFHLHLFHMQKKNIIDDIAQALLENEWNHAVIEFGFTFYESGIYVLKEKSSTKDIRFTKPL